MSALSANPSVPVKLQRRSPNKTYVIKTDEVIYDSALVGIDSNGDLVAWADTAGHKFVGIAEKGSTTGNDAASPAVRAAVRDDGPTLFGVDVANVTDRNSIGALVYCSTDNTADLTTTATTNVKAVGRLIDWRSNSDMDVRLFTPTEYLNQPLIADVVTLTDNTGGSGTHDDTVADGLTTVAVTAKTSATVTGTLTGSTDGAMADVAAIALDTSNTYTDAAVNTAVNTAITAVNLQLKELQTALNEAIADIGSLYTFAGTVLTDLTVQNQNDSDIAQKVIELVADLNVN